MKLLFAVTTLLAFPILMAAQTPADICRVTSSSWSPAEKIGTGVSLLGEFSMTSFDQKTRKTFTYGKSVASVTVDYLTNLKGKPTDIRIALAVSDKEQNALEFIDGVIAATEYSRRWGSFSVEKQMLDGDLIHTFVVSCYDERNKKWKR